MPGALTGSKFTDARAQELIDEVLERMEVGVGSGLGLSLLNDSVTSTDGAIDVATELGKGTSFTV
jgi:C4-dicarboxylate-specific signal transduction histidine kinase